MPETPDPDAALVERMVIANYGGTPEDALNGHGVDGLNYERKAMRRVLAVVREHDTQRAASAEQPEGWQSIETAPMNGDEVLIWPGPYGAVVLASWARTFWSVHHLGVTACRALRPTHWMPRPAPPALTPAQTEPKED